MFVPTLTTAPSLPWAGGIARTTEHFPQWAPRLLHWNHLGAGQTRTFLALPTDLHFIKQKSWGAKTLPNSFPVAGLGPELAHLTALGIHLCWEVGVEGRGVEQWEEFWKCRYLGSTGVSGDQSSWCVARPHAFFASSTFKMHSLI